MKTAFRFVWKQRSGIDNSSDLFRSHIPLIELWCGKQCLAQLTYTIPPKRGGKRAYELVWCLFSTLRPTYRGKQKSFDAFNRTLVSFNLDELKELVEEFVSYNLQQLEIQ